MNPIQTQENLQKLQEKVEAELEQICLPKCSFMGTKLFQLIKYENFWYGENYIQSILMLQRNFLARDNDLIISSTLKTGTTWLKSLLFAVVNRVHHPINQSPLLQNNPHELVLSLEPLYGGAFDYPRPHHLNELPSPRLFNIHLSYPSLPESIKNSRCKILYICRNPFDTLVSLYYFSIKFMKKEVEDFKHPSMEDFFDDFIEGRHPCGPFFEHVIGFWKASLEQPEKVLFLKYEDMKDYPVVHLKRLAKFIGMSFSPLEESEGVIQGIIDLCSIKTMKELEVNKSTNIVQKSLEKNFYFRKGDVGDWIHHFTPTMAERMNKLMEEKLEGTGLSFKMLP